MKAKILGVAASLRNARWGIGPEKLIKDIQEIKTQKSLFEFLQKEADIHLNQFVEAGRKDGIPFDQLYGNLRRKRSESVLSNSEIILAAALWAARQNGAEIDYLSLTDHFSMTREVRNQEALKEKLLQADGILLSTPVYFGDRGSLAHDFIEIIKADDELVRSFSEKVYGGLAVGAKRNGGQETTLIYQLLDMVNLGSFGVGNDSESTSQYGGTSHAGDVGTGAKDTYGLNTSIGTGKRVASIANLLQAGETHQLKNKARIQFWILQDHEDKAENLLKKIILESKTLCNPEIINLTSAEIKRCIACDICPTHIDIDEIYRCIIHKSPLDELETHHAKFVDVDAIIPVVYSGKDMETRQSNYQRFIERTRYLRRGDYLFTNVLTAPLVFEEVETQENMHIRMLTSMIRHHTILVKPMIGYMLNGTCINWDSLVKTFDQFVDNAEKITVGKLVYCSDDKNPKYKTVGYILSTEKDKEDEKLNRRQKMVADRGKRQKALKEHRVVAEGSPEVNLSTSSSGLKK